MERDQADEACITHKLKTRVQEHIRAQHRTLLMGSRRYIDGLKVDCGRSNLLKG